MHLYKYVSMHAWMCFLECCKWAYMCAYMYYMSASVRNGIITEQSHVLFILTPTFLYPRVCAYTPLPTYLPTYRFVS